MEAKVTPKGTCGSLWGSSEGKWGSLLGGWVAAGWPAARLAGLAGPGLREHGQTVAILAQVLSWRIHPLTPVLALGGGAWGGRVHQWAQSAYK